MAAPESDTDPDQLESFCLQEETSSGSLLPIVSMMQAKDGGSASKILDTGFAVEDEAVFVIVRPAADAGQGSRARGYSGNGSNS